jgi:hypothetical protein
MENIPNPNRIFTHRLMGKNYQYRILSTSRLFLSWFLGGSNDELVECSADETSKSRGTSTYGNGSISSQGRSVPVRLPLQRTMNRERERACVWEIEPRPIHTWANTVRWCWRVKNHCKTCQFGEGGGCWWWLSVWYR